jgi:uncharacterized protein involved in copper resistance
MSRRFHRCRVALHLLLALCLVVPGIAAPAQAVADELHAAAAAQMADAMGDSMEMASMDMTGMDMSAQEMPCGDMHMVDAPSNPASKKSGDCCAPHSCDLSACLGTGCLPELPRLAASVPPAATPIPWRQPRLPAGVIDTPLRPPIA